MEHGAEEREGWGESGRGVEREGVEVGELQTHAYHDYVSVSNSDTGETTCTEDDTETVTWSDTDATHLAL